MAVTLLAASCYNRTVNEWVCGAYLRDRWAELLGATVEHVLISVAALVLAVLIAFPMALLARRHTRAQRSVLALSTGLYTVPSLALFPLLVPFTGISALTVVIGLALYALTILVRSMLDALASVPAEVVESATGVGYSRTGRLLKVELPLGLPVMMGGLRVASVSTVALTTVGALVGHGGLGDLLLDGVASNFRAQLLAAAVLCVVIAVVFDVAVVGLQRVLTPWIPAAGR